MEFMEALEKSEPNPSF